MTPNGKTNMKTITANNRANYLTAEALAFHHSTIAGMSTTSANINSMRLQGRITPVGVLEYSGDYLYKPSAIVDAINKGLSELRPD